jgi:hypothetical protein
MHTVRGNQPNIITQERVGVKALSSETSQITSGATELSQNYPLTCVVARAGIEPATFRFSGGRSYQLSYLAGRHPYQPKCLAKHWRP